MGSPNPIRVFAAMTAHPVNPLNAGRSTTSPDLDQATAAGMCGNMPKLAFKAAMYKWAGDDSYRDFLKYRLIIVAAGIANKEKWRLPKGREYLRKMSEIALNELVEPRYWKEGKRKADYMGVDKSQFYKVWGKRYESIYQVLDGWAQDGYRYVQRKNTEV